jgi:hypothetical protein
VAGEGKVAREVEAKPEEKDIRTQIDCNMAEKTAALGIYPNDSSVEKGGREGPKESRPSGESPRKIAMPASSPIVLNGDVGHSGQ